jgi:hypothetical protein
MPVEIITAEFCATYWGDYDVPGSKPGTSYRVSLLGSEGPAYCPCKAFQHSPPPAKDCKHVRYVWRHACLWNPQWHEPGPGALKPLTLSTRTIENSECPGCGGPTVAVRIAV